MPRQKKTSKKKTKKVEESDYDSNNGFLTKIWGPMLWSVLHMISLNYPVKPTKKQQEEYYMFITSLQHVLPCGACRKNMSENIKTIGFVKRRDLKNRENFSRWVYDLHCEVNKMLHKPTEQSFEEVRDMFEMFRAKCGKPTKGIEKGCVLPMNHIKTRCVLSIVPQSVNGQSLQIDNRCYPSNRKQQREKRRQTYKPKKTRSITDDSSTDSESFSSYSD